VKSAFPRIQHSTARSQHWFFAGPLIQQEHGIVFSPVEHDGNIQQSDEEVARLKAIYQELINRFWDKHGQGRPLALNDSSSRPIQCTGPRP
jgi:hypothetical protein